MGGAAPPTFTISTIHSRRSLLAMPAGLLKRNRNIVTNRAASNTRQLPPQETLSGSTPYSHLWPEVHSSGSIPRTKRGGCLRTDDQNFRKEMKRRVTVFEKGMPTAIKHMKPFPVIRRAENYSRPPAFLTSLAPFSPQYRP